MRPVSYSLRLFSIRFGPRGFDDDLNSDSQRRRVGWDRSLVKFQWVYDHDCLYHIPLFLIVTIMNWDS